MTPFICNDYIIRKKLWALSKNIVYPEIWQHCHCVIQDYISYCANNGHISEVYFYSLTVIPCKLLVNADNNPPWVAIGIYLYYKACLLRRAYTTSTFRVIYSLWWICYINKLNIFKLKSSLHLFNMYDYV